MSIASNLHHIQSGLPDTVKLVAVSKFHSSSTLLQVYDAGHKMLGESRVQELDTKQKELPSDIEWHFIGHLQTNKIKTIIRYIHTIQSVDSWRLLEEINKHAEKARVCVNCLLEIHIAQENSKEGFTFESCRKMLNNENWKLLKNIRLTGVMGMATYTDDEDLIRKEFRSLKQFFTELKDNYFKTDNSFREISMGMSHDYRIAIEEGATIVRIGTSIFGEREY